MATEEKKPCNKDHSYHGWTNYETWCVALWIDNNNASIYRESRKRAKSALCIAHNNKDDAKRDFSNELKEWIEEIKPDLGTSLWTDLLTGALSEVNWYEIADNWIDEVAPDKAPDDEAEGG